MTRVEEKLTDARRKAMEAEASMLLALASMRAVMNELEEENRQLRQEALRRDTKFYTEEQFAELLQVSESTLQRERKDGKIQPLVIRGIFRYSSQHVEQAHEIFRPKLRSVARRKAS